MRHEAHLLGQILLDNSFLFDMAVESRHLEKNEHRKILSAITAVVGRGDVAQLDTVLAADSSIDAGYLASLTTDVASSANWQFYAREIIKSYKSRELRRLLAECGEIAEPDEAIETLEERLYVIRRTQATDKIYSLSEIAMPYTEELEERYKRGGDIPGLKSGLSTLDGMLLGFREARLYYIGARPSQGKSAMLLGWALNIAGRQKVPCGFISLESGRLEIMDRIVAQSGKLNLKRVSTGFFQSNREFDRITSVIQEHYETPLYVYDTPNQTITQLKSQARRMVASHGVQCIFVDYLQLIRVSGAEDRKSEVAKASMELKDLSRELSVPIVCAAQLRRDVDDRRPHLGDFQWSSQAEQDADAAMLIYKSYPSNDTEKEHAEYALLVEKNRDGETGFVPLSWVGEYVTFTERAKEQI